MNNLDHVKVTRILAVPTLVFTLMGCASEPKVATVDTSMAGSTQSLQVTSPEFKEGSPIPDKFSSYGENQIPAINWTPEPASARSYVLLVEDPDAPGSKPFVHWLVTNIPVDVRHEPGNGTPAKNENGDTTYYGPHPPAGSPHHYHFQVFALDLPTVQSQDRDGVTQEMKGHVVAKGELVGTYQRR
jgi:Raf kinase inhibitor-like YbhB/YbcL family protein